MAPQKKKLTVAELIKLKGKRKIVLCTAFDEWTARAAEEAGVDMLVAWGADWESTKFVVAQVRKGGKCLGSPLARLRGPSAPCCLPVLGCARRPSLTNRAYVLLPPEPQPRTR